MMIENFTRWPIFVKSFVANKQSLSYSEVPSRKQIAAPRVSLKLGHVYELQGTLQIYETGIVYPSVEAVSNMFIFDGRFGRFARYSFAAFISSTKVEEGVLVSTQSYVQYIGI